MFSLPLLRPWRVVPLVAAVCVLLVVVSVPAAADPPAAGVDASLRVMAWNIWHGGREDGDARGPQQVVEAIRASGADVVALQETYGSGEQIAKGLGFHFQPRGTNVSILSRYPVVEDLSVGREFNCVGALVELPNGSRVAFFSIWLPFDGDIWLPGNREQADLDKWLAVCQPSADVLAELVPLIEQRLADDKYQDVTVMLAGDFNSMSHLDYSAVNQDTYERTVEWPTSRVMTDARFRDSFREANPVVNRHLDATWTPRFPEQQQDRIDFVYYRSNGWRCQQSQVLNQLSGGWPSDHAAVLSTFVPQPMANRPLRIASYNIRHGAGIDLKLDLKRTADAIRKFDADVVALQEVDMAVERSGKLNELRELGSRLQMHTAFLSFMDYQGGRYGLGLLSRLPIVRVHRIELPSGTEPRAALAVEVMTDDNRVVTVVDTHLDWVADDTKRWSQAGLLRDACQQLDTPVVLLGDFNDRPGSRTIEMLSEEFRRAAKPDDNRFTFPADGPNREIDFLFVDRKHEWELSESTVVDEPMASDHRPIVTELKLP
ncbi:endonuclease/exonuclease/phosphatase family protein [Aeoliella mucimassa]|uniref:Endonuclease/exonuclease/phosphatase domain-containing protein n=1 Tax=Aeoliella mucimassa TaxID=2527972 RepID=A0A518AGK8_9BACT|nr:endonuclease/exonuclease/phosphatase family protein [Aeoliella mucimassa]QDU53858.1 hypothetical protein Pan181_00360 [Aeoliella mucimassa]